MVATYTLVGEVYLTLSARGDIGFLINLGIRNTVPISNMNLVSKKHRDGHRFCGMR